VQAGSTGQRRQNDDEQADTKQGFPGATVEDDGRPDEIELLLNAERPEMTKKKIANLPGMTSGVVGQVRRIEMMASDAAGYNEVAKIRHHEEVVACPKDVQEGSCQ